MDISVIIVSWKVKDKLQANLESLMASSGVSFECFVVDNNSDDGTLEMLETDFPSVITIANTENLGFAKACNQAISKATGEYILLLNPDMKVFPDTLAKSVNWLDTNPQAGIAGIHLVDETGKTIQQIRRLPHIIDQLLVATKIGRLFPALLNRYLCSTFNYEKAARVESIRGSYFLIRRTVIEKLGGLDERYFIWFEEVDYCHQAKQAQIEVWYTPHAQCVDYVGQSFKQVSTVIKQNYFKQSMMTYFRKWHSPWQLIALTFGWLLGGVIVKFKK